MQVKKINKNIPADGQRSDCAVSLALEIVGDKWSLLILRDLMFSEKRSYGELQSSAEKIASNILAARLATLEEHGLIRKTADEKDTRRYLYFLTEKGIYLLPVIMELMQWVSRFNPSAARCAANAAAFKKDRVSLYNETIKKLKKTHLQ